MSNEVAARESLQRQQANNADRTNALTRKQVESLLQQMAPQIQAALPKHITVERMIRLALTAVSRVPKLMECTPGSLLGSIVLSSQFGLEPNTPLGEAHILPYWNSKIRSHEAQFIIGYRGYQAMATRSGDVEYIVGDVVCANDTFSFERGTDERISHTWDLMKERGDVVGFYAYAVHKTGRKQFEVMSKAEVDKIKARSKSRNKEGGIVGPWKDDYEEMGKKTAIRRLAKRLNLSADFMKAVHLDEITSRGLSQGITLTPESTEVQFVNDIQEAEAALPEGTETPAEATQKPAEENGKALPEKLKEPLPSPKVEATRKESKPKTPKPVEHPAEQAPEPMQPSVFDQIP